MIAVYSLYNHRNRSNTGGFLSQKDMVQCLKLSMLQSAKWFDRVVLITDNIGADLAEEHGLPADVWTSLEGAIMRHKHWALTKLLAMKEATEISPRFCHMDNDFIFWENPREIIEANNAQLCFQHIEWFDQCGTFYTEPLNAIKERSPHLYQHQNQEVRCAYNCGIVACTEPRIIAEWLRRAKVFIQCADDLSTFPTDSRYSHLFEQYMIAQIAQEQALRVNFLMPNGLDYDTKLFTHFWGDSKRDTARLKGIEFKLKQAA